MNLKQAIWTAPVIVLSLLSCESDSQSSSGSNGSTSPGLPSYTVTYGDVTQTDPNLCFLTDPGHTFTVTNSISYITFTEGQRYLLNVTTSKAEMNDQEVVLNAAQLIEVKSPLTLSKLSDSEIANLGDDKIEAEEIWTAQKYLNLDCSYLRDDVEDSPRISLVYDDARSTENYLRFTLYYGASVENPTQEAEHFYSYDLSSLIPADKESIVICVEWSSKEGGKSFTGEIAR